MTDDLLLQTLVRLEAKIDRVADELAEIRGARKIVYVLATVGGALAGLFTGRFHGHGP